MLLSVKVIRPPYGNANKRVANLLNSLGYTVVTWSIDSMDYVTHNLDKEMTHYRNELGSSHGPNGAVALEHDVCIHPTVNDYFGAVN
jgi:peptidoglycan/xylan/chitin deacetylase (PgdA/CDA1 family)